MIHVFDTLASASGQLNILNKDYNGSGRARTLPKTPDFIPICIDRMIDLYPDMRESPDCNITSEMAVMSGTGDSFAPLYICTVDGIKHAAVDRISVMVDHKNDHGPGVATIIIVPKKLFDSSFDDVKTANVLREIFFGILDLDIYMSYKPSPAMLQFFNNADLKIPLYDIEMIIAAICCMNINIRSWFSNDGNPIDSSYILSAFTEKEMPEDTRNRMINVMKRCNSVADIRDAIANGRLLKNFMYPDK